MAARIIRGLSTYRSSKFILYQALNEKLVRCQTAAEVERLILQTPLSNFNEVNCATAITMLGRRKSRNSNAIDTALFIAKSKKFIPRHLSNICAGIASGALCEQIPAFLSSQITSLNGFNSHDLANTLWSFAKLGASGNDNGGLELCTQMAKHLLAHPELLRCDQSVEASGKKQTDLALLLWSFVTLGHRRDVQLFALFAESIKDIPNWRAHNMANTLWALATADYYSKEVLLVFAEDIARTNARDFNPQDLANTVWSFATLRFKHEPSLRALAKRVCERDMISAPSPLQSSLSAVRDSTTLVSELMQKLKPPSVFTSSSSHKLPILLERLEGKPPVNTTPIAHDVRPRNCFTPQNLSSTLMSFANLSFRDEAVIESIAKELCMRALMGFNAQHLSNLTWAFACLDALHTSAVREVFALSPPPEFTPERHLNQAQQLFQTNLAWKQTSFPGSRLLDALSEGEWFLPIVLRNQSGNASSQVHLNIAQLLLEHFADLQIEALVCEGGISVDLLIPSANTVVEIDGPTHFLNKGEEEEGEEPTGSTQFKTRLLRNAGYHVHSISVRKFEANPRKRIAIACLAQTIKSHV